MTNKPIVIYWFRQDLRLRDNPALTAAANGAQIVPVYILDELQAGQNSMGGASRWWLHHSLEALNHALKEKLSFYKGDARIILPEICKRYKAIAVYWNRCYEPERVASDILMREVLKKISVKVLDFNGSLLWEPEDIQKQDSTPYKLFAPFYQKVCFHPSFPRQPLKKPELLEIIKDETALALEELTLLAPIPWHKKLETHWRIGEEAAQDQLQLFLEKGIQNYKEGRNFPSQPYISRLSPHLHFGEISPNQVWYEARALEPDVNIQSFCRELVWREFSYHLLSHFPSLPHQSLQTKFEAFPWRKDSDALKRWQRGETGYPIVDAGMRELWQTGYMHNRLRMIVASFLVKNLLMDWRLGERWFWDCLVDADLANNSTNWQWVAGCGTDAAPYFRIFNPVTQGQKFDPNGNYTRKFVPELKNLPDKYLFTPWEAPPDILSRAGILMGKTYPMPIVDIQQSRGLALKAFAQLS